MNKIESYDDFSMRLWSGGDGIVENEPEERL
ncbi:hypothetical protein AWB80_07625 [Caballeronia pedi]|uniref:Uncharacterized protein n=1 Tax=Caballeronia pedi TaxID=1777141 RepID=A0A158DXS1_9BURK|nr:hypothetical protein AWB80_07625 [Caballeronia pedi]